jgi:DNA gyrase subunit A
LKNIAKYEDILENHSSMSKVIIKELQGFKKEYSRPRRTQITNAKEAVFTEKKFEEMDVVFLMDRFGYCRTVDVPTFERNKDAAVSENKYIIQCKNTDKLCIFTDMGHMHLIKISDLPFGKFRDKSIPIDNFGNYKSSDETMIFVDSLAHIIEEQLLFTTEQSWMKLVQGQEFNVAKRTIASTKLSDNDKLISVSRLNDSTHAVLQTHKGLFLKFAIEEIPEKKKGAVGVRGMKLTENDLLEAVYYTQNAVENTINYKSKNLVLNSIKLGKRDTKGIKVRA